MTGQQSVDSGNVSIAMDTTIPEEPAENAENAENTENEGETEVEVVQKSEVRNSS